MPVPGMITPNVVGSTYQNLSPEVERELERQRIERDRKREASNAAVMAQRNAQQKAARDAADQEKVHAAFNEIYGPQLQRQHHDLQFMKGTPESHALQARWGPDYLASGMRYNDPKLGGGMPHFDMPENQLQTQLDNMWRQKTDPYYKAAAGMAGDLMLAGTPGVGGSLPAGNKGRKKITTNRQDEEEKGIDWQKASGG